MLIRYACDPSGQIFYKHNSNIGTKVELDEYIIDDLDSDMFTVTDVCYCIYGEETEVDVTVKEYDYGSEIHDDYLESLAKDVNIPNAYR